VGGVIDFRLFQFPEGPRPAMKWTVRNVFSVEDRLRNIPYPDPTSQVQPDPLGITFKRPSNVFMSENDELKVGVWDEVEKVWSTSEIEDIKLDMASRQLEFMTKRLA
jgi:hypothetical protein